MTIKQFAFQIAMKVRDYECDTQGVVNNANYLHYLENTRHEFLENLGVSFVQLQKEHIDPMVSRINIQYKTPLTGGEHFISRLNFKREGIKIVFLQEIVRETDMQSCCKATVDVVVLQDKKLTRGDYFDEMLKNY